VNHVTFIRRRKKLLAITTIPILIASFSVAIITSWNPISLSTPFLVCQTPLGMNSFLIIENLSGMNNSEYHNVPTNHWPIIQVTKGESITIKVCNFDRNIDHGLSIASTSPSIPPVELSGDQCTVIKPLQTCTIKFVANEMGTFNMTDPLFTPEESLMESGLFVVNA